MVMGKCRPPPHPTPRNVPTVSSDCTRELGFLEGRGLIQWQPWREASAEESSPPFLWTEILPLGSDLEGLLLQGNGFRVRGGDTPEFGSLHC